MTRFIPMRAALLCTVLGGSATSLAAQAYTPPPPPLTTLPPCPVEKDAKKRARRTDCDPTVYPAHTVEIKGKKAADPSAPTAASPGDTAAQKFPFPGEQPAASVPAAKAFPYPGDSAPLDPAAAAKAADTPAGKSFPFPGEPPAAASGDAVPTPETNDSSSSSSGSSSSADGNVPDGAGTTPRIHAKNPDDDDEDQPKLSDKGSEGKRSKKVIKPQTDTDRVDEDLSVARFYGQSGNFMGAYLRARDAVNTQPDFADGHFALGDAAKHLKKKDEAVAEFQAYLKLAPDGEKAKAAEKALDELQQ